MKGTIEVNGLRLYARHGVMEQERIVGNLFEVTAHLVYPFLTAAESDSLSGTLNYASAIDVIKKEMEIPSDLLEHAAFRIKTALCREFPDIEAGMVKIAKLTPPIPNIDIDSVAVKIEW